MALAETRRATGLSTITKLHDPIAEKFPAGRSLIYLDYAFTTNVGDQLIVLGTLEYFRRIKADVRYSRNIHNSEAIENLKVKDGDILVLHGGGNFGDIYPHFQNYREEVIDHHQGNRIVIMPQTVHFSSREKLARSSERMNKHPDLTLFVRDKVSYEQMKPFFGERVQMAPDMAHHLFPSLVSNLATTTVPSKPPLYLFRTDPEKGHVPPSLEAKESEFVDWDELISKQYRLQRKIIRSQYPIMKAGIQLYDLDKSYFELITAEVSRMCNLLNSYPIWFTSRMHGAILGLLLGKPVFALDNSYGKLSTYFDAWDEWIKPIVLLRSEEDVKKAIDFSQSVAGRSDDEVWAAYRDLAEQF